MKIEHLLSACAITTYLFDILKIFLFIMHNYSFNEM